MKKCKNCGKEYTPKNPKGKYCSDKCRVYGNRKKINVEYNPISQPVSKEIVEKLNVAITQTAAKVTVGDIKAWCPKELTGIDRSIWITEKRKEYGV